MSSAAGCDMSSSSSVNIPINTAGDNFPAAQDLNVPPAQNRRTQSFDSSVPQDTVSISQQAQQLAQSMTVPQSTAAIVERLHAEGVPTEIIAAELQTTSNSVENYITAAVLAASA